jgi:nicotinamidase-related amidase
MTNIENIIRQFSTHDWIPEEGKTAVLLIDLQEYFREIIRPILENVADIISSARERSIPLLFTQHGHDPGKEKGMLGLWWTDLIFKGSRDALLLPELKVSKNDVIIPKKTYSAFHQTCLEEKLASMKVTDLVIGGVMTNLCCETTARDAFVRNFRVFFLADGTSTVSEDFHQATLKNLGYGFATLLTCRSFYNIARGWRYSA